MAKEVHALLRCNDDEYRQALEIAKAEGADNTSSQEMTANAAMLETQHHRVNLAACALKHCLPKESPPSKVFKDIEPFGNDAGSPFPAVFFLAFVLLSISLYGALHLLGWNEAFPSSTEQLLWWISTVILIGSGPLVPAMTYGVSLLQEIYATLFSAIIVLLYMFASGFLLVESVRQLFFLPPAAHEVTSLTTFWPHFS